MEAGISDEDPFNENFKSYMANVEQTRNYIRCIDDGTASIDKLLILSLDVVTNEQSGQISRNLNKLIEATNSMCTRCKNEITRLEKQKSLGESTEKRMRENAYNVCVKHFQNAMKRYQDAQVNFKKSIKERAVRQIQLIHPDVKQDELQEIMAPNADSLLAVEYLAKSTITGKVSLKDAVSNIQEKYNDVLALEQSVEELHQMMVELAGIVSYQGDLIDQIEHNAVRAVEYTEKANVQLIKAQEAKRRGQKLLIYITSGLTIAVIVTVVPIVLKLT
ncbi:bifunctional Syntaxin [Babesia duncani]|uniref:Bifunctional Syntaxin n=1 Tax=Babesia duncani TaxID=323732 RepID=A0AAD9UPK6_9APIC|nr:bifunctional Syntaxin [Babesia duncani]